MKRIRTLGSKILNSLLAPAHIKTAAGPEHTGYGATALSLGVFKHLFRLGIVFDSPAKRPYNDDCRARYVYDVYSSFNTSFPSAAAP